MDKIQTFTTPCGDKMVILPKAEYDRLAARHVADEDDDEDVRMAHKVLRRVQKRDEPVVPLEVYKMNKLEGMPRLRAWRTYHRLSLAELARKIKKSQPYLTQLENGTRNGTLETMRKLAKVFNTTVDSLLDE